MTLCDYFDGSAQDCSNSSALAMELLQSCTEPSICVELYDKDSPAAVWFRIRGVVLICCD